MLNKASLGLLSFFMILVLMGCSSSPVSPQKPWTTVNGDLIWVEDSNIDYMYKTILRTLEEMKFSLTKEQQDGLSGEITAKTLTNKKVQIMLKAETADWTRITIRVGFYWTNQDQARVIYDRIKQNLT